MANEITLNLSLQCTKSGATVGGSVSLVQSQTGNDFSQSIMHVTNTAVVVPVGSATTAGGWLMLTNLGSAGVDSGVVTIYNDGTTGTAVVGTLAFGESMLIKPSALSGGSAISAKYVTSATDLAVIYIEP